MHNWKIYTNIVFFSMSLHVVYVIERAHTSCRREVCELMCALALTKFQLLLLLSSFSYTNNPHFPVNLHLNLIIIKLTTKHVAIAI